jgi:hypothetical protein
MSPVMEKIYGEWFRSVAVITREYNESVLARFKYFYVGTLSLPRLRRLLSSRFLS